MFNERTGKAFNLVQCPTDVVMLVVLWRLRYKLSLRDLVEMFAPMVKKPELMPLDYAAR